MQDLLRGKNEVEDLRLFPYETRHLLVVYIFLLINLHERQKTFLICMIQ